MKSKSHRTVKFLTLGCKANQYDTQVIREQFISLGFKELNSNDPADFYVINTCTVTHRSDASSLNFIRRAKKENPKGKLIVTGCLTELDGDRITKIPGVNYIIKNREKERIVSLLQGLSPEGTVPSEGISYFKAHTRAFLKIQDGCDNFCSYCKVPLVRGHSRSRPLNEIVNEARGLVKNGFKEIVLCGVCLGSYGKDLKKVTVTFGDCHLWSLIEVITALENIDGLARIRLSSIEAGDVTDKLIKKIAASSKLCRHLHIPIQSGDDRILKKMKRKYSQADYISLLGKIKKQIPGIAITTDCLVGFPGETEENFRNTINLVRKILPLKVHIFPYSRRGGTLAAEEKTGTPPLVLKERVWRLKNIADSCALNYKKKFLGKKQEVLIEGRMKLKPDYWQGYTDNYLKVIIKSKANLKGRIIPVRLKKIKDDYFLANLLYKLT